jgi:glycosyltransferase involved in cell wall biosynthesis
MQRSQHLVQALAQSGCRCFYLNPNLGREFRRPVRLGPREWVAQIGEDVFEIHVGLPREPVFHHRLLRPEENKALIEALERILSAFVVRKLVLVASFPVWMEAAIALRGSFGAQLFYDCHDLCSGFRNVAPAIAEHEREFLSASDRAFFSSQGLLDLYGGVCRSPTLLRNGVNAEDFGPAARKRRGSSPVIGYVGALDDRFDVEAVQQAAMDHPNWKFVLLGSTEAPKIKALRAHSNVELKGEVPYSDLPRYLGEFDVGLIPFVRNPLTMACNPVKLYQYFSCGLPVVSSRLPEVEQFPDFVYLADSSKAFSEQVGRAALEDDPEREAGRREIAARESWLSRAEAIVEIARESTKVSPRHAASPL